MTALQAAKIVGIAFHEAGVRGSDIVTDIESLPLNDVFSSVLGTIGMVDGELCSFPGIKPKFHLVVAAYLFAQAMTPHLNGFIVKWYDHKLAWEVSDGKMTPVEWPAPA